MTTHLYLLTIILLTAVTMTLLLAGSVAYGITCFHTGDRVSGLNKICYYDCAGSEASITVESHEVCPTTIDR